MVEAFGFLSSPLYLPLKKYYSVLLVLDEALQRRYLRRICGRVQA
jgi:hypothetical protein